MSGSGIDLFLVALDVSLDRRKVVLAVLDVVLAASGAFAVGLLAGLLADDRLTVVMFLVWALAAWVIHGIMGGAIARMSYERIVDGRLLSLGEAVRFALDHVSGLVVAPILWLVAGAVVVAVSGLALQVGRVPEVGGVLTAMLFLPLVVVAMAGVPVVLLGLWLTPATVAAEGRGAVATFAATARTVARAPARLVGYGVATVLLVALTAAALTGLLLLGSSLALTLAGWAVSPGTPPGSLAPPLSAFDATTLADLAHASVADLVALFVYVLYWTLLVAGVAAVPLYVFPLAASCAASVAASADVLPPPPPPSPAALAATPPPAGSGRT